MMIVVVLGLLLQAAPVDPQFKLPFKQNIPSEVTMDIVDAIAVEFEVALQQATVTDAKENGATLGEWLVTRGVCPDTNETCKFTIHFAGYVGKNPSTQKMEFYLRYVVQSESGKRAEGFSQTLSSKESERMYWTQKGGFWLFMSDTSDQKREHLFYGMLLNLARTVNQKPDPPPQPLPPIARPTVT